MGLNISTREAKILRHAPCGRVWRAGGCTSKRRQELARGPLSPIGAALPDVLTPVERPAKLLDPSLLLFFLSLFPLWQHGEMSLCSYIKARQAHQSHAKIPRDCRCLGPVHRDMPWVKACTPPAQTEEAVGVYRCSHIRVTECMAEYYVHGRSSKVFLLGPYYMLPITGLPQ